MRLEGSITYESGRPVLVHSLKQSLHFYNQSPSVCPQEELGFHRGQDNGF